MIKKIIGSVTLEEKNTIKKLFERRNGLNELARIVSADNVELYERLVNDIGENTSRFNEWWESMGKKYNWETGVNSHWEIDFNTCEISLVTE